MPPRTIVPDGDVLENSRGLAAGGSGNRSYGGPWGNISARQRYHSLLQFRGQPCVLLARGSRCFRQLSGVTRMRAGIEFWALFIAETIAAFSLAASILETLMFHSNGDLIADGKYWPIWRSGHFTQYEKIIILLAFGSTALVGLRISVPHEPTYTLAFEIVLGVFAATVTLFLARFALQRKLSALEIAFSVLVGVGSVGLLLLSGLFSPLIFLIWLILAVVIARYLISGKDVSATQVAVHLTPEKGLSPTQFEEFLKDLFWISFILALALVLYPRLTALPTRLGATDSWLLLALILVVAIATVMFEFASLWLGRGRAACEDLFLRFHRAQEIPDPRARQIMLAVDRHILIRDAVLLLGLVVGTFAVFLVWELVSH